MNKFLERYKEWGFEQESFFPHKQFIRINTNLINPKKLISRLEDNRVYLKKIDFLTSGFQFRCDFPLSSSIEYLLGYFYIQEAPAQIPGEIIRSEVKDKKYDDLRVLDMCSAPGGKTTHISEIMRNKGEIIAIDSFKSRIPKLCNNLERMKVENVSVLNIDALEYYPDEQFDIVLLDAPCSGNFTQDKGDAWFEKRSLADFKNRQRLQTKLIEKALILLKKGGLLIYSTCSLEKEENEEVVESILSEKVILEDINISVGHPGLTDKTKKALRIWPTQDKLPGFFIAKIRKT